MNVPQHEPNIQIDDETEAPAFCLRRMETVTDSDCHLCFDAHEQLQAGYRSRLRCAELHWVEIAEFLPSPSALGNRIPNGSDPLSCPSISHPPKERHRRWT
jgi:hypothetical protein